MILISFSLIQRIVMWKMTGMGDLLSAVEKKSCRHNIFFRKRYDLQVTRLNNRCICFHLLSRLKIKRKYMISCGSMSWVGRIPWQKKHGRHRAIYAMISLSIPLVIFSLLSTRAILPWTWDNVLSWTKTLNEKSGEKNVYKRRVPDPVNPSFSTSPLIQTWRKLIYVTMCKWILAFKII